MVIYSENILPDVNPRLLSRFHTMFDATRGSRTFDKIYSSTFSFFFFLFREWNHGDIQKLIKKESKHRKFIVRKNDSYICYQKFHDRILSPYTSNSKIGSLRNSGERNVGIKSRYRSELLRLIYAEPPPLSATAWNRRGLRRFDGLDAC